MCNTFKAILMCVDYADILCRTLPYNRHHFDEVMVVTTVRDTPTMRVATANDCRVFITDSFYENGASFAKWKALELGLDALGRTGWLCIMDADVYWPKVIPDYQRCVGTFYTPKRRMMRDISCPVPSEDRWSEFKLHRNQQEFPGYSQIFHADDPHLGEPPWHETNWKHAGGADSFFQKKWPRQCKVRPPFEVLHVGAAGTNWCGRVMDYADGTKPSTAEQSKQELNRIIHHRRKDRNFDYERY